MTCPTGDGAIRALILFRWASETRAHGMPTPASLARRGWRKVRRHPWWPTSWLMVKR